MRRLHTLWFVVFALAVAAGCNAVLGNDEGQLVPPGGKDASAGSGGIDGGGTAGTGGGGTAGVGGSDGGTCSGTKKWCGSSCVDTSSDPAHCGSCTALCEKWEVCRNGSCLLCGNYGGPCCSNGMCNHSLTCKANTCG